MFQFCSRLPSANAPESHLATSWPEREREGVDFNKLRTATTKPKAIDPLEIFRRLLTLTEN